MIARRRTAQGPQPMRSVSHPARRPRSIRDAPIRRGRPASPPRAPAVRRGSIAGRHSCADGLLPAAALSGRLSFSLLGGGCISGLPLALAKDAPAARGIRTLALGWLVTRGRRRLARSGASAGLARHRDAALPVGAFLDHQDLGLDVALDAPRRADLEPATAIDVALVVAVDDDVVGLDRAAHAGLRADDQGPLALDLALCLALDAQVAVAYVLSVEAGVRVDDRLVAAIRRSGKLAG